MAKSKDEKSRANSYIIKFIVIIHHIPIANISWVVFSLSMGNSGEASDARSIFSSSVHWRSIFVLEDQKWVRLDFNWKERRSNESTERQYIQDSYELPTRVTENIGHWPPLHGYSYDRSQSLQYFLGGICQRCDSIRLSKSAIMPLCTYDYQKHGAYIRSRGLWQPH